MKSILYVDLSISVIFVGTNFPFGPDIVNYILDIRYRQKQVQSRLEEKLKKFDGIVRIHAIFISIFRQSCILVCHSYKIN